MRTTVRLDEDLMGEVRRFARAKGMTLTSVLDQALRDLLMRQAQPALSQRVRLPTFRGKGLQPGVDLDDSAALLELMERSDGPDRH